MIVAIIGDMPALERRLSSATKSGTAANVVPKPATKPNISDRRNPGKNRLCVSRGTRSWQPQSVVRLKNRTTSVLLLAAHRPCRPTGNETLCTRCPGESRDPYCRRSCCREVDPGFRRGSVHVGCRREQRCFFLDWPIATTESEGPTRVPRHRRCYRGRSSNTLRCYGAWSM